VISAPDIFKTNLPDFKPSVDNKKKAGFSSMSRRAAPSRVQLNSHSFSLIIYQSFFQVFIKGKQNHIVVFSLYA
jgi:hypothetical protein